MAPGRGDAVLDLGLDVTLPPGALGLDQRLERIETGINQVRIDIAGLVKADRVDGLEKRIDTLEKSSVSRGTLWAVLGVCLTLLVALMGTGLGFMYQLLRGFH